MAKQNEKLNVELENAQGAEFVPVEEAVSIKSGKRSRKHAAPVVLNVPKPEDEVSRLFPRKAQELMKAQLEWYRFNDTLQKLCTILNDEDEESGITSPKFIRLFQEDLDCIHDKLKDEMDRILDDHALMIAF